MNTKVTFTFAKKFDKGEQNEGFSEQTEDVVLGEGYTFEDYCNDNTDYGCEQDNNDESIYWVLDQYSERTGAAYMVLNEEKTTEPFNGQDIFATFKHNGTEGTITKGNPFKPSPTKTCFLLNWEGIQGSFIDTDEGAREFVKDEDKISHFIDQCINAECTTY